MSFRYDKENLFKEFYVAKDKDIALSKRETQEEKETDYYTNRNNMEWTILILIILMFAIAITYAGEIYLFLTLSLGSLISDIKDKLDSIISRKK